MAKRSPILGYNHNIRHRGLVFHVQTEDSGVDNPHIFTHVFHGGVILNSRKLVYDAGADEDVVKSLMQAQHKALLKDLKSGKFADKIDQYLGGTPGLLPFDAGHDTTERPETQPFERLDASALDVGAVGELPGRTPSNTDDAAAIAPTVELKGPPSDVSAAFAAVKVPDVIPPAVPKARPPAPTAPLIAPVVSFKDPSPSQSGTYSQRRTPKPPATPTPRPQAPPPVRPPVSERAAAAKAGGVVVSRPAVIVGAPSRVVGGSTPPAQAAPKPRPRTARTITGSEKTPESLFGQGLISEKSLDEVILAYLSDDSAED